MKECPEAFFFGSAGWGGGYYIGIYNAIENKWSKDILGKKFYGVSVGSLICLYIMLGFNYNEIDQEFINISQEVITKRRKFFLNISSYIDKRLQKNVTEENIEKLNGKLFIGVTTFYGKFQLISHWENKQQLIDTIHASMHIPYYCGNYIKRINNKMCLDGGYGCKDYTFLPDKTLKIGVWDKDIYDIGLTPSLNFNNSRKPNIEYYSLIKKQGFEDLSNWNGEFKDNKLKQKKKFIKHLRLQSSWLLRISERLVYTIF